MKKSTKISENMVVETFINEFMRKYPNYKFNNCYRLNTCNAYYDLVGCYAVLKSYNTIVAIYDYKNGIGYDFLRYVYGFTSTSCQHINKFFHKWCNVKKIYTWRDV